MGEQLSHTVYTNAHRETTLWDDAQRKHGNLPPLPPEWKPEVFSPATEQSAEQRLAAASTAEELQQLEARCTI